MEVAANGDEDPKIVEMCNQYRQRFEQEMNDDFNTSAAIGQVFEFSKEINKALVQNPSHGSVETMQNTFLDFADRVLGILPKDDEQVTTPADPFVDFLIELRNELRAQKNWSLADKIRVKLTELSVVVEDEKSGTRWSYKN